MRAIGPHSDHSVADRHFGHQLTDGLDRPSCLVSHDVRMRRQLATQPVQRVATLDGDRLDSDEDLADARDRVGDLFDPKHLRPAILVIDRCSHVGSSPLGCATTLPTAPIGAPISSVSCELW